MGFLAHRYPRIRRHTADQLYIKLVEGDSVNSFPHAKNLESAMVLLSEIPWEIDSASLQETINRIGDMLGIQLMEIERKGTTETFHKGRQSRGDEFESYASLVKAMDR